MNFLGIGVSELFLVAILVILVFKPEDLVAASKKLGKFLNQIKKSGFWESAQNLRKKANKIGQEIINESGIEEIREEFEVVPDLNEFRKGLDQFGFVPNKPPIEIPQRKSVLGASNIKNIGKEVIEKDQ